MTGSTEERDRTQAPDVNQTSAEDTIHDEHPAEPAEGSPQPGTDAETDLREHPSEPSEGRTDIER